LIPAGRASSAEQERTDCDDFRGGTQAILPPTSASETGQCVGLFLVDAEHLIEPGNDEHLLNLRPQVAQLQPSGMLLDRSVQQNQLVQRRARQKLHP
jgi:hypothetical protein